MTFAYSNLHRPVIRLSASLTIVGDGPSRMVKRPTGSDGEPSSPNCGVSAGVKARHLISPHLPPDLLLPCLAAVNTTCDLALNFELQPKKIAFLTEEVPI